MLSLIYFERYPKQQRLLNLKKAAVANHSLPSSYLPISSLSSLATCKFDVILLDPPYSSSFTWENLQELPIPALAADPSFVFMWVGSGAGDGLERGREVLAKWGYRRCEDVVWVKTNKTTNCGPGVNIISTLLIVIIVFMALSSQRQIHPRLHYSHGQSNIVLSEFVARYEDRQIAGSCTVTSVCNLSSFPSRFPHKYTSR